MQVNEMNQVLSQIRQLRSEIGTQAPLGVASPQANDKPSFGDALMASVNKVNEMQQTAGQLAASFERGDSETDIANVMVAMQKASIGFQAMTQVRNRMVSAYQDIMNMPV